MSEQATSSACFTLNDLLTLNLPHHARATIYRELTSCGTWAVRQYRLVCRSLRALIDEYADGVYLSSWCLDSDVLESNGVPLAWMESLCASWHQRWPRASKLKLELKDDETMNSCLPRPFACAPPEAFLRLTHLTLRSEEGAYATGDCLAELLRRVPGVQNLAIEQVFAAVEDSGQREMALAASALSSLTRLEHLALTDYDWWPCVQPGLAAQLKTLRVGKAEDLAYRQETVQISDAEVASAVAHMTALEELQLDEDLRFSPAGLLALLEALPPTLRRLKVAEVLLDVRPSSTATWECSLADGKLLSVEVSPFYDGTCNVKHVEALVAILDAVLLGPSRVMGPRLPSLTLDVTLFADEDSVEVLRDLGPNIWGLAARCDELHLWRVKAKRNNTACMEAVLAIARLLAVPQELEWGTHPRLELPRRSPGAAGSSAKAGGGGGEASGLRAGSAALTPAQAAPRVMERAMQKAMVEAPASSHLLLFGPAVSSRLVFPRELRAWVAELNSQAAEQLPPQPLNLKPLFHFRAVPSFGAVEVSCVPGMAGAVAEAGRRAGAAVLTAGCSVDTALAQVLEELWRGEEAGGPEAHVGALDRLRWLLETMEAVAALLPPQESL